MSTSSAHNFGTRSTPDFKPTIFNSQASPYDNEGDENKVVDQQGEGADNERRPDTSYIVTSSFKLNANTPLPGLEYEGDSGFDYRSEPNLEGGRDLEGDDEDEDAHNDDDVDEDEDEDEYDIIDADDLVLVPGTNTPTTTPPRDTPTNTTAAEGSAAPSRHLDEAKRVIAEYARLGQEELTRKLKQTSHLALDRAMRVVFGADMKALGTAEERVRTVCEILGMAGTFVGALAEGTRAGRSGLGLGRGWD